MSYPTIRDRGGDGRLPREQLALGLAADAGTVCDRSGDPTAATPGAFACLRTTLRDVTG